jgi:hypothetical protein
MKIKIPDNFKFFRVWREEQDDEEGMKIVGVNH